MAKAPAVYKSKLDKIPLQIQNVPREGRDMSMNEMMKNIQND